MFGWLHSRSTPTCQDAALWAVSRRWVRLTPHAMAQRLPWIGNVLYVHAKHDASAATVLAPRLMVEHGELAAILQTHFIAIACVITDDGPREWCECVDLQGQVRARLHLLPDTDYLAWDALMSAGEVTTAPIESTSTREFKPFGASVMRFRTRELATFIVLRKSDPLGLSRLGADVAMRIAHAEAMPLTARPALG